MEDERLAASRALLQQGEKQLEIGDFEAAISSAREGLAALGSEYASMDVDDDTDLKIAAAERRIDTGHHKDGAGVLLRMLNTRIGLYSRSHEA